MKKKILIIIGIILALITILYLPIPIGEDIKTDLYPINTSAKRDKYGAFDPGVMAPSKVIITKYGFVVEDDEDKKIIKLLNLINKLELNFSNEKEITARKLVK